MSFSSIRVITDDVTRLAAFYEHLLGRPAERPAPVFAQFPGDGAALAIGDVTTVAGLDGTRAPRSHRTVFLEFEVPDFVDAFSRLRPRALDVVKEPHTTPWGNRSALIRDPDGNVVNLFSRPAA